MRIYPMVWISVTSCTVILILYRLLVGEWHKTVGIWQYITSMLLIFKNGIVRIDRLGINNPIWYLSILLVLYVVYWIILRISKNKKISTQLLYIIMIIVGLSCSTFFLLYPFFNVDTARGLIPFFVGCFLATIADNDVLKRKGMVCFYFSTIIVFVVIFFKANIMIDNLKMILVFLVYPALILFMLNSKIASNLFNHKIFGEMGKISFEMFLWHIPIFDAINLLDALGLIRFYINRTSMFISTIFVVIFSVGMYYLIEKPIANKTSAWLRKIEC